MTVPFESIQGFAGPAGVGVVCLIAILFIVSAFADNLPNKLKQVAPSWGAVATIPVLLVGYVLGLLAISVVFRRSDIDISALVGTAEGPGVSRYLQVMSEAEILAGSVLAFILLGVGAGAGAVSVSSWRRTLIAATVIAFLLAIGSGYVSTEKKDEARQMGAALKLTTSSETSKEVVPPASTP